MNGSDFRPRDFLETTDGLMFAVVDPVLEDGRVLAFLRYVKGPDGWHKKGTAEANAFLQERYPDYLHHSQRLDAHLHAVPLARLRRHHRPAERLRDLLAAHVGDRLERTVVELVGHLLAAGVAPARIGVTGSLLIGCQKEGSDIDLVIDDRQAFTLAREAVRALMGQGVIAALGDPDWRETFGRRGCALDYESFVWHERRKFNKGMFQGVKFDLALVAADAAGVTGDGCWRKAGHRQITARVVDDRYAFDQPARFGLDHPTIPDLWCFTHTYAGQARVGETIEAAGLLEIAEDGRQRLIVGSSREAPGEFIRVCEAAVFRQPDA